LHDSGCTISIDDLGSGFSALRYVRDLPVDVLKVDRALISAMPDSPSDRAVVRAICEMAQTMGIATVAEGVELSIDFSGVEELGFQYAQ
ncbi:EAL domain-containing protein, partial [Mycobacterium tuberculosis]|nr:EAL domain-containing protein [Mycobacterium tuberculosis]